MIRQLEDIWVLDTDHTSYCFGLLPTGQLEHLYYGARTRIDKASEAEVFREKHAFAPGNTILYDQEHPQYSLEDMRLEMSAHGKGDTREPFVEIVHADGGRTSDFVFEKAEICDKKTLLETLPSSYEENGDVQELVVTLKDAYYGLALELHYCVFPKQDVITRWSKLVNQSKETVKLLRLLSTQLDFAENGFVFSTFNGAWAREMMRHDTPVTAGRHVSASCIGSSGSRSNPFVMLSAPDTNEDAGVCYACNLIYSGNHYEAVEVSPYGKTRFVSGINPQSFCFTAGPGESFESPEAVMTFSDAGFNGMSRRMHDFVRQCVVRGEWKDKLRPVLLNSWEAAYFDIDEKKLLRLAKAGKDVGAELLVMDDGWFGERDNDRRSLGDWTANEKKLPEGLDGICKKINALGMEFGIWVEPEMVNIDSDLYRRHPDWVMELPGKSHAEGRNQRILDLANPAVCDYLIETMSGVFSSANISYVKWDMNRIFSDCYSQYLDAAHQGETAHRYMMGLYRIMDALILRFPHILFEGCASGGNRFDLGMLCYFPQIWASDDTDAVYRVNGQTGYSYGYPMNTVSAHVSACPNHQTLRRTPLETRFHVAAFGVLGYECNLCDMKKEELAQIREQITLYKQWRDVLQRGRFYRGRNGNVHEWTCVSQDQSRAVGFLMQELMQPNTQHTQYAAKGLDPDRKYTFTNRSLRYSIKDFGDLVNTVSPVHIRQDSLLQTIAARLVTMPGETESYTASGQSLMAGVQLKEAFAAVGYDEETRHFPDFASRIYFMESKEE